MFGCGDPHCLQVGVGRVLLCHPRNCSVNTEGRDGAGVEMQFEVGLHFTGCG